MHLHLHHLGNGGISLPGGAMATFTGLLEDYLPGSGVRESRQRSHREESGYEGVSFHVGPFYYAGAAGEKADAGFFWSVNSPREIGTATFSIKVKIKNPNAKIPAATRNSTRVGVYS